MSPAFNDSFRDWLCLLLIFLSKIALTMLPVTFQLSAVPSYHLLFVPLLWSCVVVARVVGSFWVIWLRILTCMAVAGLLLMTLWSVVFLRPLLTPPGI